MDNAPGGEFKGERMLDIIKLARRSKEVLRRRGSVQEARCAVSSCGGPEIDENSR